MSMTSPPYPRFRLPFEAETGAEKPLRQFLSTCTPLRKLFHNRTGEIDNGQCQLGRRGGIGLNHNSASVYALIVAYSFR